MSYTLDVPVTVRNMEDARKLLGFVMDYNKEGQEETGEDECYPVCAANWEYDYDNRINVVKLFGDPYDLGEFMIRLFTQEIWQGGCGNDNLPVWDGTYDPARSF